MKIIVHIDLNTFFVRLEELRDPSLIGKPVAIGHEGRAGIVSTCSYEARKYGVHSGQPMFQAKRLCPNLIIRPVDFNYVSVMSKAFQSYVKSYTKKIEMASCDECYADFTYLLRNEKDVEGYFRHFQRGLYDKTGLKCSIGIAPTKFLAKMGSDMKKPNGITIIRRRDLEEKLYPLEIEKMFGVGKKTAPRLKAININTIGDFARELNANNQILKDTLGKSFDVLKSWVNGFGSDEVSSEPWDPKSIGASSTFMHDTDDKFEVNEMIIKLAKEVSSRAKKEYKVGTTVQLNIKDIDFKSHSKSHTFKTPTNDYEEIAKYAYDLYEKNYLDKEIRLVGVTLQNLLDPKDVVIQMTFFDYEKHEEENMTRLIINEINRKLKKPLLLRASEVEDKKK